MHAEDGDKGVPREIRYGLVSEGNPFTSFFDINDTTGEWQRETIHQAPIASRSAIHHFKVIKWGSGRQKAPKTMTRKRENQFLTPFRAAIFLSRAFVLENCTFWHQSRRYVHTNNFGPIPVAENENEKGLQVRPKKFMCAGFQLYNAINMERRSWNSLPVAELLRDMHSHGMN